MRSLKKREHLTRIADPTRKYLLRLESQNDWSPRQTRKPAVGGSVLSVLARAFLKLALMVSLIWC
jgi:hypothetical protein